MGSDYGYSSTRNLGKTQLGGVIFGAKKTTIKECISKQLFGLPHQHFVYVKKIDPGLPLFLFNYTDRTLLGIFEAASSGQMNIDPYAWNSDGSQRTPYPSQVQIRVKLQCKPLTEIQFKPIIMDNYFAQNLFWFELDHAQTNRLLSLLSSQAFSGPCTTLIPHGTTKPKTFLPLENERVPYMPLEVTGNLNSSKSLPNNIKDIKTFNIANEKEAICMKLKELALKRKNSEKHENVTSVVNDMLPKVAARPSSADRKDESSVVVVKDMSVENIGSLSKDHPVIAQLIQKVEDLMVCKIAQNDKIVHLEKKIAYMEQNLAEAEMEIKNLKDLCHIVETSVDSQEFYEIKGDNGMNLDNSVDNSILLVGGYDGVSWLSSLDCFTPSQIMTRPLEPMNGERCYAAVTKLDGDIFVFGGGTSGQWFDTAESYNPGANQWTICPPLSRKNGSLGGATVNDKIYAVGGGNGVECYSAVEMLDFDIGSWIPTRSMLQKRFALAAAELNGALYAVGGYDENYYLRTAERFDPREHSWKKIASMSSVRGCPSMVVLNEKLYVIGGYDGDAMVSTVEVYDPRAGSWMTGEPMNHPRGFSAAAVAGDSIYVFGGLKSGKEINDTVECYKEGRGWEMTNSNVAWRKCFLSAIAL
ncbi:uncharacterized protein LOC111917573 [Lactuca sativa]|uniref:DCD domain-containing protein n=1 Tax=Lactuca sativa TaxID=4236 RepID=A0A9R1WWV5_LACSA|nr:uncharacterized protein LOC111917573 [Lactuca sativa]XP_023769008.1 uncharacterized protein LOC111917573 [Lactuca sativa]KAJ0190701.1 hypothetical protein LSAT_V11C800430290 [Lactuca sativa]